MAIGFNFLTHLRSLTTDHPCAFLKSTLTAFLFTGPIIITVPCWFFLDGLVVVMFMKLLVIMVVSLVDLLVTIISLLMVVNMTFVNFLVIVVVE